MPNAAYCLDPSGGNPTPAQRSRAAQLGCGVCVGDASGGQITVWPTVVITSPVLPTVLIPDDVGEATIAAVQAAMSSATTAEANAQATKASANAQLQGIVAQLAPWLSQTIADDVVLKASNDPLAPIIQRMLVAEATIAEALALTLMLTNIIPTATLPALPT